MRRHALPAVLVLLAILSGFVALQAPDEAGGASGDGLEIPRLQTPVLSARRVPDLLVRTVGTQRLRAELDAILADPQLGPARSASCLIVESQGHRLYEARGDVALIPASTLKVLTAAAALSAFGPDATFTTDVRASKPPVDGVVDGDIYLVGGGDPLLSTGDYLATLRNQPQIATRFEAIADAIVAAGIREVRGRVVGDHSRYDDQRLFPTWKPEYVADGDVGPVDALVLNDGFLNYRPLVRDTIAADPAAHAAGGLALLLQARGVPVAGGAGSGVSPAGATTIVSVASPPMREVVAEMLTESDNNTAEILTKELGFRAFGQGTWERGIEARAQALARAGLPVGGFVGVDGSGLDRRNRLTCALLQAALNDGGEPLAEGFAVAARTGTLSTRFVGTPVAGKLRGKTGSLREVVSLTGYVEGKERVGFSLVLNDLPRDRFGFGVQERVAAALLTYPQAPPAADLAPLPVQR
ncbi:MAG: D-alanyl-D-alanine carboxypeptidase/D-alanyl-D-alanine-endopeptidase [Acidimicrobiia bacterium]